MTKFAKPEESYDELEKMVVNAENIVKLVLHTTCGSSLHWRHRLSAAKTYDRSGSTQNTYRGEISSCSNTEDFPSSPCANRCDGSSESKTPFTTFERFWIGGGRTVFAILKLPKRRQFCDHSVLPYIHGWG